MIELVSVHEPKISMNTVNNQSPKKAVKTWKLAQPYQNGQDTLTYQVSINEVGKDTVMVASNGEYVKMNHVGYSNPGSAFKERKITFGEYAEKKRVSTFGKMEFQIFTPSFAKAISTEDNPMIDTDYERQKRQGKHGLSMFERVVAKHQTPPPKPPEKPHWFERFLRWWYTL